MQWRVRNRRSLFFALFQELGERANISFEGELSACDLSHLPGASASETEVLRRNTLWPKQDFIVMPFYEPNELFMALGGTIPRAVLHIQIEVGGQLAFAAYDNFQHVVFGDFLTPQFIAGLIADDVVQNCEVSDGFSA